MLRRGSRGDDVVWLQGLLNSIRQGGDAPLKVDGIFGANTAARVKQFQGRFGLQVDGIVGPDTFHHLLVVEDPFGYGRDAGVVHGPALPPPGPDGPPPAPEGRKPQPPGAPNTRPGPRAMSEAEVRAAMRANLSPRGMDWVMQSAHGKTLVFWLSRGADVGKIAAACGVLDGVYIGASGVALGPMAGVVGAILFPIGAAFAWERAVTTNERHYGWMATCYAATHWIFSDTPNRPMTRSEDARARHDWLRDEAGMARLDDAWRRAWAEQMRRMEAMDLGGASRADFRETTRMMYDRDAARLCDELKVSFDRRCGGTFGGLGWDGGGTELENWKSFRPISYPD